MRLPRAPSGCSISSNEKLKNTKRKMQFVKTNLTVQELRKWVYAKEWECIKTDFTPFFIDEKQAEGFSLLAVIKFILFCDTLILRFVDSFSVAKHRQTPEKKMVKRENEKKGKRKRSDNKRRWDHIRFSISCFIHPYSLETRKLWEKERQFIRLGVFHHFDFPSLDLQ